MMDAVGTSYARRYNFKYKHAGHVFQGRYRYARIPSEVTLLEVARYIHLNPVRAGLVSRAEDWEFSDFRQLRTGRFVQPEDRAAADRRLLCSREYAASVQSGIEEIKVLRRFQFGRRLGDIPD